MAKFKAGDVVKLVNIEGLYGSQNRSGRVRLELGETYPVTEVEGAIIRLMKSNGETEGCYPYRVELVTGEQTAESLKNAIFSIRQEREQTLSKLKDLDTQEAEAISQLNALGFSLFEEGEVVNTPPSKTVLHAEDIEEDMTDPKNWEAGDVIESLDRNIAPIGSLATVTKTTNSIIYCSGGEGFIAGHFGSDTLNIWKFHSRPVK